MKKKSTAVAQRDLELDYEPVVKSTAPGEAVMVPRTAEEIMGPSISGAPTPAGTPGYGLEEPRMDFAAYEAPPLPPPDFGMEEGVMGQEIIGEQVFGEFGYPGEESVVINY